MIDQTIIRKQRCKNGGETIVFRLSTSDENTVITDSYIKTNDPIGRKIANRYEYLIALAKTNPEKYLKNRDRYMQSLARWILDQGLFDIWSELILVLDRYRNDNSAIIDALFSELMETWNYFSGYRGELIYGSNTNTKELYKINELYGDWDYPLMELQYKFEKGQMTKRKFNELKTKFFENEKNFEINNNENIVDINIINMIPLINQRTKQVFPKKFLPLANSVYFTSLPTPWKQTEYYRDVLMSRSYMLDNKGVVCELKNAGCYKSIYIVEDLTKNNDVVMLYRLDTDDGSFMGYYIPNQRNFFSPHKYSSGSNSLHPAIENFVLGIYADLVCDLEKNTRRIYAIERVDDIDKIDSFKETKVYYQALVKDEVEKQNKDKNRSGGWKQTPHRRKHSPRKLREGQEASSEAIERAREYGIELKPGYTFVQPYYVGDGDHIKDFRNKI